ncbi:hypothetical protein Hbl1158_05670 [Halobaculum sp. CBA1158]|nr:hypothetical protein [Halobaculum sp. CBA1158]UIP00845.1 hypothetical protein Hbl1158_05670 [Halobaculum sp. CBA1158]
MASRLRSLVGASEDRHDFECTACGFGFDANRQQCPECGGFDIRRA